MHRPSPIDTCEEQGLFFPSVQGGRRPAAEGAVKNFVLDTNVLLHDPHCLNRFENNHVFIPVEVLSELDRFKNEQTERGANARTVHRFLTQMFGHDTRGVTKGVKTSGGGSIRILVDGPPDSAKAASPVRRFRRIFPDQERADHRIIGACLALTESEKAPTILVTKDLNMQLKAMAIGLNCQDYLNDKVAVKDAEGYEIRSIPVEPHELQRFGSSREIQLDTSRTGRLEINEYVLLTTGEHKLLPGRHLGTATL